MKKYFITVFMKHPDGSLRCIATPTRAVNAARLNELFEKFAQDPGDPFLLGPEDFSYRVQTVEDDTPDDFDVEAFKIELEKRLQEQEEIRKELSQPKEDPDGTWRRQGVLAVRE